MKNLSKYFNGNAKWWGLGTVAFGAITVSNFASGGLLSGIFMTAMTAGMANSWQRSATGKPFWEPKTPFGF